MMAKGYVFRNFTTILLVACFGMLCQVQSQVRYPADFSADYVGGAGGTVLTGRYYSSKGGARTELVQNGKVTKITIGDTQHKKIWDLNPESKTAYDMSVLYRSLGRFYEATEPQNPCSTFTDYRCSKVGSENVNGRQTERWHLVNQYGASMDLWVDRNLQVVVKMLGTDGISAELRNIKQSPQPDSLFALPPDYHGQAGVGVVKSER